MIDWNKTTKKDTLAIRAIVKRVVRIQKNVDSMSTTMDIEACHTHGCKLDLDKLAKFDDFNLMHDVCGINRHIDRETGELQNCFLPRCAA